MLWSLVTDGLLLWWGRLAGLVAIVAATFLAQRYRRGAILLLLRWGGSDPGESGNLQHVLLVLSRWVVWAVGALAALRLMGADVWQVLTGAGIVGVAVGLGAQNVVRDMIAGFFIMVENQFRPGDYIQINGEVEGVVESLDLRMTKLRGWDGAVVCIGNAAIIRVKNYNRDAMRVIVEASVPFEADHARVRSVMEDLCVEMARSHREHFLHNEDGSLMEPPFLYGVTDINSARGVGATYCIMALTQVGSYWFVAREIRRLLLERLREHELLLAYPQRIFRQS